MKRYVPVLGLLLLLVAAVQTHAITITFLPPSTAHHPPVQGSSGVPVIVPTDAGVVGAPTISAAFINQVLTYYHSPAVGTGQALYDLGKASGIDPVFALAFFQHESMFGTLGWARVNRSLGNIRCEPQYPCNGGYARYSSWVEGYRDWYRLVHDLSSGQCHLTSVRAIIHTYAPGSDHNDEEAYARAVLTDVAHWQQGEVRI